MTWRSVIGRIGKMAAFASYGRISILSVQPSFDLHLAVRFAEINFRNFVPTFLRFPGMFAFMCFRPARSVTSVGYVFPANPYPH